MMLFYLNGSHKEARPTFLRLPNWLILSFTENSPTNIMFPTQFNFESSPCPVIKRIVQGLFFIASCSIILSNIGTYYSILLFIILLLSTTNTLKKLQTTHTVIYKQHSWLHLSHSQEYTEVLLQRPVFASPFLIILRFKSLDKSKKKSKNANVLLTPHSISRDLFRHLYVFLRFYYRVEGRQNRIFGKR